MYKMTVLLLTKKKTHPLQTVLQSLSTVVISETALPCDLCVVFSHPTKEEIISLGKTPLVYYVESDPMTKDIDMFLHSEKAPLIDYTCILLCELFSSHKSYLETRYPTVPIYDLNSYLPSYPLKLYDGSRPPTKNLNIFIHSSNSSFTDTVWRQLCIAEHIYLKTPDLLNEVYLFNVPTNKCAVDMYENLEIFKNKKLRTFIDFDPHQIVQHFNLQPQRSVYLMNSVTDVFDPLAYYCLQNQLGVVHSSKFMSANSLGKYYNSYDIDTAASHIKEYLSDPLETNYAHEVCKKFSVHKNILDILAKFAKPRIQTLNSTIYNPEDLSKPLVIAYDNTLDKHHNTQYFINSCSNNNWEYVLVSLSEKWNGFKDKTLGIRIFLDTLPNDKIVVISDTRDVICCRTSKQFIQGFTSKQCDFLACMELFCLNKFDAEEPRGNCVPLKKYWAINKRDPMPLRKFVNAGLFCGKVSALKTYLQWSLDNNYTDDQIALGNYMNMYPTKVFADTEADILHTSLYGFNGGVLSTHYQKQDSPTFAELFGSSSFFLHIPGENHAIAGQNVVYKYVKIMLDKGAKNATIHYKDYPEVDYFGNFVDGSKIMEQN